MKSDGVKTVFFPPAVICLISAGPQLLNPKTTQACDKGGGVEVQAEACPSESREPSLRPRERSRQLDEAHRSPSNTACLANLGSRSGGFFYELDGAENQLGGRHEWLSPLL